MVTVQFCGVEGGDGLRRGRSHVFYGKVSPFLLAAFLLTGCGSGRGGEQEAYSTDLFAMDTYMSFTAYGSHGEEALAEVRERMAELEGLWSVTEESSEVYRVNHSGGQWVAVSGETAELIAFALEMAEETGGALDPTIYPILEAWGFTTEENHVPREEELQRLLTTVDHRRVRTEGNRVALEEGMMLDLGAVGKGYAGDLAVGLLREKGVTSALLDIGGNIQALGSKPDGRDWRIGVRSPFGEGSLGVLEVSDRAVVTSGCYERYFVGEDGKRYGHIIDPATGYPVENGLLSVTVIAKEGRLCDALSTSLFVMGLEKAVEYWRSAPEFEMLLVTEDGTICLTEGIRGRFTRGSAFQSMKLQILELEDKE